MVACGCAELQQGCDGLHLPGAHFSGLGNISEESQGANSAQSAADGGVERLDAGEWLPALDHPA